jgi:hypothetical protein
MDDIINIKFTDYRRHDTDALPSVYLFNMYLECVKWRGCKSDYCVFILQHYKYHIYGHKKYHEIKEKRASLKITRFFKTYRASADY